MSKAVFANIPRDAIPRATRKVCELAIGSDVSPAVRLGAIKALFRIIAGPKNRAPDRADEESAAVAHDALARALPHLNEIVKSHHSAPTRSQAAKLRDRIKRNGRSCAPSSRLTP